MSLDPKTVLTRRLTVSADVPGAPMRLRDAIELAVGSRIPLSLLGCSRATISFGEVPLGGGNVVTVGDRLGLRMTEVQELRGRILAIRDESQDAIGA